MCWLGNIIHYTCFVLVKTLYIRHMLCVGWKAFYIIHVMCWLKTLNFICMRGFKEVYATCYVLVEKHYTLYMLCVA